MKIKKLLQYVLIAIPLVVIVVYLMYTKGNLRLKIELGKNKKHYKELIAQGEKTAFNYHQLGVIYMRQRQYDDALQCLLEAHKIDPTHFDAIFSTAVIYYQKSLTDKLNTKKWLALSISNVDKASEYIGKNPFHCSNVAMLYERLGEYKKALEYHKLAIDLIDNYELPKFMDKKEIEEGKKLYLENYNRLKAKLKNENKDGE